MDVNIRSKICDDVNNIIVFLDIIHRPDFYLKSTKFRSLNPVSFFRRNLLSWAQSVELVPVSEPILLSIRICSVS
jgi:hypothetical protein